MFEKLKDLYYKGEEKWYAFWDKANEHIPVYGIIDKIDAIVPSFVLFLILILFLLLFGAFILFAQSNANYTTEISFFAPDGKTKIVDSVVSLKIIQGDKTLSNETYRTDSDGIVLLENLKYGQEIEVDVNLSKGTYNGTFLIDEIEKKQKIILEEKINFSPVKRNITLKDYSGMTITKPIEIIFWCENKAVNPNPTKGVTENGVIQVTEPFDCIKLNATTNTPDYEKRTYIINSTNYEMVLTKYEPPKTELKVKVRDTKGSLISDVSFTINVSGEALYSGKTLTASEATINVVPGIYSVAVNDPTNKYATKVVNSVQVETKKEITIEVTREVRARINVKILNETTSNPINEALVSLKNSRGILLGEQTTESDGEVQFAITDVDNYQVTAKKLGDLNGGYYAKTIDVNQVSSDVNITLKLEKITIANAGKTTVRVIDQDGEAVSNAKIMLKYQKDDAIVELNQRNNWAMSDLNGYVTFLAGKVDGAVYAYAMKYPFYGSSDPKTILVDKENDFTINMNIGQATIKINLTNEGGEKIDGTGRVLLTSDNRDLSGLLSIEQGVIQRSIKAGQLIYLALQADGYENYITEPRMLFPSKTYTFNIKMKAQISKPQIFLDNIYNENDLITRTMQTGKKYYAKLILEADQEYDDVLVHFRVGKEKLLENDYMEIDKVEGAMVEKITKGTSYDPDKGYSYDNDNLTDGYAKWINIEFEDFERGTRLIKVWFSVKRTTPANQELQFFYRANFDGTKDPTTTNTGNELYDSVKSSNIYFVGEEATCEESFCITNESLYWNRDDLYVNAPYEITQAESYTYKYQLVNNSDTDYGTDLKKMYLNLELINDEGNPIKILSYNIKDNGQEKGGSAFTKLSNFEVNSFNKNTAIDFTFSIEGNEVGASAIKLELKSDGVIIYTKESTFNVPSEKQMQVSVKPTFVPALANTPLVIEVYDSLGEPINKATVKVYAKEPGFDEYLVDQGETTRVGKTQVNSGAHFSKTKVIIEITKEGFARTRLSTTVSEDVVAFNPSTTAISLNTISKREDTKEISIGNQITHDLKIINIKYDTSFDGVINESAMQAASEELIGTIIPEGEIVDVDLIKVRLVNSITQDDFLEPINLEGEVIVTFQIIGLGVIYDKVLPLTINVSSEAKTESSCLIINNATQTKTTQLGQVSFDFEILNACTADSEDVDIDSLYTTFSGELKGSAEISIISPTSGNSGRTALDGMKRKTYDKVKGGETLIGKVTYTPSQEAIGSKETLSIVIEGKFQGKNIKTTPGALNFSVNVLNLQECMSISSSTAPVGFEETTTVSVDASGCLGQKIEVYLCRNDAGCSGGAEGKISLSKRTFTLQGDSETIDAYSPSIPGTYGVTVHARVKGKSSFTYIGEVPVTFREDEDKYFQLSKYDLMIVGDGSEDIILLTNSMLTQDVRVKADECIWGRKSVNSLKGSDWLTVMTTAMLGATLGNMIGSNFNPREKSAEQTNTQKEREQMDPETRQQAEAAQRQASEVLSSGSAQVQNSDGSITVTDPTTNESITFYSNGEISNTGWKGSPADSVGSSGLVGTGENVVYTSGNTRVELNRFSGEIDVTSIGSFNAQNESFTFTNTQRAIVGSSTTPTTSVTFHNTTSQQNVTYVSTNPSSAISDVSGAFGNYAVQSTSGFWGSLGNISVIGDTYGTLVAPFSSRYSATTPGVSNTGTNVTGTGTSNNSSSWIRESNQGTPPVPAVQKPGWQTNPNTVIASGIINKKFDIGLLLPSYLSEINSFKSGVDFGYDVSKSLIESEYKSASFTGNTTTTSSGSGGVKWGSGIGSLAGAIIGGIIGYIAAKDGLYQCDEHYQVANMTDFVIFLQGDSISVTNPAGTATEEKSIPSDAGALGFTLEGVSASWDFTDASYGETEDVGMKFTNTGINDAKPRYGTLTINANKHIHGSLPGVETSSTTSSVDTDYDVWCKTATFGDYWIGDTNEDGNCTGVSNGTYSQKYHIRVISGEPSDEEAYLKKSNSCTNEVLTGSTGIDALPKVKLNWDWDEIEYDTCGYENSDYVYCDATQTTISMIKRLARLEDFLSINQGVGCPVDAIYESTLEVEDELNSYTESVSTGYIGVEDIDIVVEDNHLTATIKVNNKTGTNVETYYYYAIKGSGEPVTPDVAPQKTFAQGETTEIIEADISTYEGTYYFTAVFNGPNGNRRAVTRAFQNREATDISDCWIEKTTRSIGGVPAISYFFASSDTLIWTNEIQNSSDLADHINFGAYLIRDSYSEDFLNDFRNYYIDNFAEKMTPTEREILDYISSGKLKFSKRFSGDFEFEAGLYDAWFYIDFGETMSILDSNADVEVSLLSVRNPVESSPFYYIPFDGMVGEKSGRNGYGAVYKNLTEGKDKEIQITGPGVLNDVITFENIAGNGVVSVDTKNEAKFINVNSTLGTRGQLASVSYDDYEATINFIPNYATPVIMKKSLNGTSGEAKFNILENYQAINVGGNLNYWTGAAKSKDFYGSSAIDVYNDSPDSRLDSGDYGFRWDDATQNGNLYLKTIFFTPAEKSYIIESAEGTTTFWTPNSSSFSPTQQLIGIQGMEHNNQLSNSTFSTLQDLFNMVAEESVCVSNDGSNMLFWWNLRTLANTAGTSYGLEDQELALIGQ